MPRKLLIYTHDVAPDGSVWECRGDLCSVAERAKILRDQQRAKDGYGFVYAITFSSGLVKVGSSHQPHKRLLDYVKYKPVHAKGRILEVAITRQHWSYRDTETATHDLLAEFRGNGEYFRCSLDAVESAINDQYMEVMRRAYEAGYASVEAWEESIRESYRARSGDLIRMMREIGPLSSSDSPVSASPSIQFAAAYAAVTDPIFQRALLNAELKRISGS